MPSPYRNLLRLNDRVYDTATKRQGKVANNPRETSVTVAVQYDGNNSPTALHISRLRAMPDGKTPEDVAPHDGEIPLRDTPVTFKTKAPAPEINALDILRTSRQRNTDEMATLEKRFKTLKADNEKLDRAIEVLTAT